MNGDEKENWTCLSLKAHMIFKTYTQRINKTKLMNSETPESIDKQHRIYHVFVEEQRPKFPSVKKKKESMDLVNQEEKNDGK